MALLFSVNLNALMRRMILRLNLFVRRLLYPLLRLYWYVVRPVTSGSKVVLIYQSEVLLIKHIIGKAWTFPGGRIEKGELPIETAKREIQEELAITLDKIYSTGSFFTNYQYKQDTVHCFWAEVENKNFIIDPVEITEAKWFPKDQIPLLGPNAQKMYQAYLNQLFLEE